jgi:fibronectin type 3 domain-containing protein
MISGLAYTDLAVQAGTTYYYVVTASDDHGEESANSVEAVATVPSP